MKKSKKVQYRTEGVKGYRGYNVNFTAKVKSWEPVLRRSFDFYADENFGGALAIDKLKVKGSYPHLRCIIILLLLLLLLLFSFLPDIT